MTKTEPASPYISTPPAPGRKALPGKLTLEGDSFLTKEHPPHVGGDPPLLRQGTGPIRYQWVREIAGHGTSLAKHPISFGLKSIIKKHNCSTKQCSLRQRKQKITEHNRLVTHITGAA